ncbi:hypothetical protein LPJ64_002909 [Coemansia asiatica]|uniref:Uncharacterized protein n=1 Tax=Coemansia asiatica TaxID=1052880 RepID=A0A9W7XL93_9FUNG|nr:hypothetical protein LPJ64_002909 [Coemansia asiatica]
MSSLEAIQALNQLMKRAPSKRTRKERSKQNIDSFIRRTTTKKTTTANSEKALPSATKRVNKPRYAKSKDAEGDKKPLSEAERRLRHNARTLQATNRLVTKKSKELEQEVVELLNAQRENRRPKRKAKKEKMPFFDFEDLD